MEMKEKITNLINENDVCLFMKGTPDSPQCGFSMAVSNLLKHLNVGFQGVNVLEDENLRQGIKDFSDWPTIPQLYIKGELKNLLTEKKNNLRLSRIVFNNQIRLHNDGVRNF